MRDRLIELIGQADDECKHTKDCKNCSGCGKGSQCMNYHIADYLIANGVTAMPEKVYWYTMGGKLVEAKVHNEKFIAEADGRFQYDIPHKELGKTVFLTREEAEAKLQEGKG